MIKNIPKKLLIACGLMLLLGLPNLWEGVEGDSLSKGSLITGGFHIVLAIGLLARINAAKIMSILVSVGGALTSIIGGILSSFLGYRMNTVGNRLASSLSNEGLTEQQAEAVSSIFLSLPWVLAVSSLFFLIAYSWIFLFLTSEQGAEIFSKNNVAD